MAASLGSTFFDAVTVFNNTFTHRPPYTPAELANFGRFSDPGLTVVRPHLRAISPRDAVLDSFAQSSPLRFGPNLSNLGINEVSRIVKGDGPYHDEDNEQPSDFRIHFEFKYELNDDGWIITLALARRI